MGTYSYEQDTFVIQNYPQAKPFASFLPGLAGKKGIPMWTFYVNRGQAISGFGIQDKNSPIMEFSPASIAYKTVAASGFRTFLKRDGAIYEPFQTARPDAQAERSMRVRANEISLEEVHHEQGLRVKVSYFHLPNEDVAALVRHVEIGNEANAEASFELLDGLPEILPYGVENGGFKEVGHLLRSWMEVGNREARIPFYKLRSSTHDEAEVSEVVSGHFYLSFSDEEELLAPIVDPDLVFGDNSSLAYPDAFAAASLSELQQRPQYAYNKVPCGFTGREVKLAPGQSVNLYTLIGHVSRVEKINERAERFCNASYIRAKRAEANELVAELTNDIAMKSGQPILDAYSRQCYLDNLLRGGYPYLFGSKHDDASRKVVHLFSRKHGDLERDYNFFSILPEFYSQGNGNFRDANQNRRSDVFFHPGVGTFNIRMFYSLIQADGYNPLGVEATTFVVKEERASALEQLLTDAFGKGEPELAARCRKAFTPGKVIGFLADHGLVPSMGEEDFLGRLLDLAEQQIEATFGEGFWSDHWTYNLDLVDAYLSIYPDKKRELLLSEKAYPFYDSAVRVLPRSEKYVLKNGTVRQFGSIVHDDEKMEKLGMSLKGTHWLKTEQGMGAVYTTNLLVKMLSLGLNKFATLDPYGMGVEMEANKPGWNDAMNGLPGIVGSGMSETFELKRHLMFLAEACEEHAEENVRVPEEILAFLETVKTLAKRRQAGELEAFAYWNETANAREAYREQVRFGFTGREGALSLSKLASICRTFLAVIELGIERAVRMGDGLAPTYFRFEATRFEPVSDAEGKPLLTHYGLPKVRVSEFTGEALPLFLEGPARWLKTVETPEEARSIHDRIKRTALYDEKLHMFKTSVSLDGQPHEIGRIRAFTPGWLERESVFMHMAYKYVLELLRNGLYAEFEEEMQHSLVPFMDPEVYGRSTLENSSFIATSVNPDPHAVGRGFYARLSGSTAEFLSMWIGMMAGDRPFRLVDGELALALSPVLPGWLFDASGRLTFRFLGTTEVTYRNPTRGSTYGENAVRIQSLRLIAANEEEHVVEGARVTGPWVDKVRSGHVKAIDIVLG
ncbi:cellobiose phosphorylase [Gorillibacterium sp. CAU 1737]|uniref:cellobiose phosphorylase n=1 Tax=Gorillibacterium sp. CAU 1737 TaxID=3140362 RepID=UPI0032610932